MGSSTGPPVVHPLQLGLHYPDGVSPELVAPVNCDSLYSAVGLSSFGGGRVLSDLASLSQLRRVVHF